MSYTIPTLPLTVEVETKAVMKQTNSANKKLAELKGIVRIVPNPSILIRTVASGSQGFFGHRKHHHHAR